MTAYTPETITQRLIEAYRTEKAMPAVRTGPSGFVSFFAGMVMPMRQEQGQDSNYTGTKRQNRNRIMFAKGQTRVSPTGAQIDRMHESLDWLLLIEGDGYRRALMWFIHFKIYKGSVSGICRQTGLNRMTFYRQKDRALQQLSLKLSEKL